MILLVCPTFLDPQDYGQNYDLLVIKIYYIISRVPFNTPQKYYLPIYLSAIEQLVP